MNSDGFTLVEMMVVIAMIAIVLSIATLNFPSMLSKANTEKQAGEMLSLITSARMNAMQKKLRSSLVLGPNQFVYKTYSSDGEALNKGITISTTNYFSETKKKAAGSSTLTTLNSASDYIEFDNRGYTSNTTELVLMPVLYGGGLNCISVETARTSIGRMVNATTCQKQ